MHVARKKFLCLLVLGFAFVSAARAEVGGKITGEVKDQTGSVIAGANVVVTSTQTGVKLTATTDQDGVFTFPVLSVEQHFGRWLWNGSCCGRSKHRTVFDQRPARGRQRFLLEWSERARRHQSAGGD